ncbi:AI-2E family transporter [Planococcus maritimus]|nr:AI-2E family transporter [Planococcus sp. SK3692]MDE4085798.1 AI-2E family transporter [Planococcus maritimus]
MTIPKTKWFRFLLSTLLIFAIINLAMRVPFVFYPIGVAFSTLMPIIIIGGILFYIFRPIVKLLSKKMPRIVAILLIFILFIALIVGFSLWIGPLIFRQIQSLIENFPSIVRGVQNQSNRVLSSQWWSYIQEQDFLPALNPDTIAANFRNTLTGIGSNILSFTGVLVSALTSLVVVPFVLFFLLKDGDKLPASFLKLLPQDSRAEGAKILHDMDENLSAYIQGQAIVSLFVGVLSYITYLVLGVDYAIVLALVATFTNVIPYLGPIIGAVPAIVVAFFQEPILALWVLIGITIVQQVESNFISPNIMGKKLAVHPVTIIFLLYIGGNLAGLIGMILVIPTYAVGKAIVQNLYRLIRLRYPSMR